MYRNYENPKSLEERLSELKKEYNSIKNFNDEEDEDLLISLKEDIEDLEERINFAYQDEEY